MGKRELWFMVSFIGFLIGCRAPDSAETVVATQANSKPLVFDGDSAYNYLRGQTDLGPRYPGSAGHLKVRDYIDGELQKLGWKVERQSFEYRPNPSQLPFVGVNLIGRANQGAGPVVILGAHYDTRARSDQSFGLESTPTIGAVDGGSGVAVLLELAKSLDLEKIDHEIWLTFFDLEDNGNGGIESWDWIRGSTYMAQSLTITPTAMVLVDMIGDADQQLYYEHNSDPTLQKELWQIAHDLGFEESFFMNYKYTILDDHIPFLQRGIPSVDIIDFDYPYWHTVEDTLDKASPQSLFRVGRTLEVWLEKEPAP